MKIRYSLVMLIGLAWIMPVSAAEESKKDKEWILKQVQDDKFQGQDSNQLPSLNNDQKNSLTNTKSIEASSCALDITTCHPELVSGSRAISPAISKDTSVLADPRDCPTDLVEKMCNAKTAEEKETFHELYLAKYFPRALIIRGQFLANMAPKDIDLALEDLVKIFKVDPGFYFANDAERVKIWLYLEVVVNQLSLISEFLKKAYIDLQTQEIFLIQPLLTGIGSTRFNCTFLRSPHLKSVKLLPKKQLITYLREKRLTAVDRFYATFFDYLKKLFNQAILFQEQAVAQKRQNELKMVMDTLRGTEFERIYQDPFNVGNELLSILQAKIALDAEDDDDDEDYDYADNDFASSRRGRHD